MPLTRIETRADWLETTDVFVDAIADAVKAGLRLTDAGTLVLRQVPPAELRGPATTGPRYTLLDIYLFPGRAPEWKRDVKRELVDRLASFGLAEGDINLSFHEVDPVNAP